MFKLWCSLIIFSLKCTCSSHAKQKKICTTPIPDGILLQYPGNILLQYPHKLWFVPKICWVWTQQQIQVCFNQDRNCTVSPHASYGMKQGMRSRLMIVILNHGLIMIQNDTWAQPTGKRNTGYKPAPLKPAKSLSSISLLITNLLNNFILLILTFTWTCMDQSPSTGNLEILNCLVILPSFPFCTNHCWIKFRRGSWRQKLYCVC